MWLLSKNRLKDAENSLRWLRGWVPASAVQKELNELIRYRNNSRLILPDKKRKSTEMTTATSAANGGATVKTAYANPAVDLHDENQGNGGDAAALDRSVASDRGPDVIKCSPEASNEARLENGSSAVVEPIAIIDEERKATLKEHLRDMVRPQMLRPMMLVIAFFTFHNGSGFPAMRPYMVKVFEELKFPVDPHWATVSIEGAANSAQSYIAFTSP